MRRRSPACRRRSSTSCISSPSARPSSVAELAQPHVGLIRARRRRSSSGSYAAAWCAGCAPARTRDGSSSGSRRSASASCATRHARPRSASPSASRRCPPCGAASCSARSRCWSRPWELRTSRRECYSGFEPCAVGRRAACAESSVRGGGSSDLAEISRGRRRPGRPDPRCAARAGSSLRCRDTVAAQGLGPGLRRMGRRDAEAPRTSTPVARGWSLGSSLAPRRPPRGRGGGAHRGSGRRGTPRQLLRRGAAARRAPACADCWCRASSRHGGPTGGRRWSRAMHRCATSCRERGARV